MGAGVPRSRRHGEVVSVYRTPAPPPRDPLDEEKDPFPTLRCYECGARHVSMCGEALCPTHDLKWLLRGVDVRRNMQFGTWLRLNLVW